MAQFRITEIEDYEALVGAEVVQRIRDKADKLKRPARREFQFHLLRRWSGRNNFFAHSAHEQPWPANRVESDSGHP
jgi:hypothetical protein